MLIVSAFPVKLDYTVKMLKGDTLLLSALFHSYSTAEIFVKPKSFKLSVYHNRVSSYNSIYTRCNLVLESEFHLNY